MYINQENPNLPVSFWFINNNWILVLCEEKKEKLAFKPHKSGEHGFNP